MAQFTSLDNLKQMSRNELYSRIKILEHNAFVADAFMSDRDALEIENKRLRELLNHLGVEYLKVGSNEPVLST